MQYQLYTSRIFKSSFNSISKYVEIFKLARIVNLRCNQIGLKEDVIMRNNLVNYTVLFFDNLYIKFFTTGSILFVSYWRWPHFAFLFWIHRTMHWTIEIFCKLVTIHNYSMRAISPWSMSILFKESIFDLLRLNWYIQ